MTIFVVTQIIPLRVMHWEAPDDAAEKI